MMRIIKEILLLFMAIIGFIPLFFAGILYTFLKHSLEWNYSLNKQLAPIIHSLSLALDGLANAGAGEMMTDNFIQEGGAKYGKWNETISRNTGENLFNKNLTKEGKKFRKIIDGILGKDHCLNTYLDEK